SVADGIKCLGQVVGVSYTTLGLRHAFLWTAAGGMVDLGTFWYSPVFFNINDAGQVVGQGSFTSFLWTAARGMVRLYGGNVEALNNSGQLVGSVRAGYEESHASIWTYVESPEGQSDFNGDGRADLLWRNARGDVTLWLMNGTQILGGGLVARVDPAWRIAATDDFNG